ncbi:bacterial hemoglobin [Geranomyces variabilis]|nr:bacterial hemoglobin [Geranomyces variabilis]KAJ3141076.1 hypothetical protein HDU90_007100 [Geranomyces variabilis]
MCAALTPQVIRVVKSTAPVLEKHGVTITSHFYKRMLTAHPTLKNIFNSAHQDTGTQQKALAHAVWAYAANIDNLAALGPAVSRIAHKHVSLNVEKEQYAIVGRHLLASIKEVLGDAATPEILDAWAVAYQVLADIFITTEADLTRAAAEGAGGWRGWRSFVVDKKVVESSEITSFHLKPKDGSPLPTFVPGQFISLRHYVPELGVWQPRQYSLSDSPHPDHFRISVKREDGGPENIPAGKVSTWLHEHVQPGSEVQISHPFGDFVLNRDASTPVVLVSGGVGLTPMTSMMKSIISENSTRPVVFVHSARNPTVQGMKEHLHKVTESGRVDSIVFYTEVSKAELKDAPIDHKVGLLDLDSISKRVLLPDADYFLCGPLGFMAAARNQLAKLGVPQDKIHWEVFGSTTS